MAANLLQGLSCNQQLPTAGAVPSLAGEQLVLQQAGNRCSRHFRNGDLVFDQEFRLRWLATMISSSEQHELSQCCAPHDDAAALIEDYVCSHGHQLSYAVERYQEQKPLGGRCARLCSRCLLQPACLGGGCLCILELLCKT